MSQSYFFLRFELLWCLFLEYFNWSWRIAFWWIASFWLHRSVLHIGIRRFHVYVSIHKKVVFLVVEYLDWLSALFRRSERVWAIGIPLYWKLAPPLSQTLSRPYHFRLGQHSRVLYGQACYISYKPSHLHTGWTYAHSVDILNTLFRRSGRQSFGRHVIHVQ